MMANSMEGSSNSNSAVNQKQVASSPEEKARRQPAARETANDNNNVQRTKNDVRSPSNERRRWQDHSRDKYRSIRRNPDVTWTRRTRYQSVPTIGGEKKWWLKWLPGLKNLRFPRRSTMPEVRCALDEAGNPCEELTMWSIRDDSEQQRPV